MEFSYLFIFSCSIAITTLVYQILGDKYAIDVPNNRKIHKDNIPQIGGLIFGSLFLVFGWYLKILPNWYLICGAVTILIGTIDDNLSIKWQIKLLIQLLLLIYLSFLFWDCFNAISFYSYTIKINKFLLLSLFALWFIGIYNAVNLIDGLDGLSSGYIIIICLFSSFSNFIIFKQINLLLAILLLGFLLFNQRPAKIFMGDAGSLFLGFHIAVLPLLIADESTIDTTLLTTPFVLFASFLIADTTRVFFTRLINKRSPMTPDTIHFHHIVLQQSGSYLGSLTIIFLITIISAVLGLMTFSKVLHSNYMIAHLSFLLLFILTPPIETYIPIFTSKSSLRNFDFSPSNSFFRFICSNVLLSIK